MKPRLFYFELVFEIIDFEPSSLSLDLGTELASIRTYWIVHTTRYNTITYCSGDQVVSVYVLNAILF